MACKNCETIRALLLHGKMAAAAGLTIETLRDKIGYRGNPVENTTEGLRTTIAIDAASDHRRDAALDGLSGKPKAELIDIADREGVEVAKSMTNAELVTAILANRGV